jgi:hypothetical protein
LFPFDYTHNADPLDATTTTSWPDYGTVPSQMRRVSVRVEVLLDVPAGQQDEQVLWHLEDKITRNNGENGLRVRDALALRVQEVLS